MQRSVTEEEGKALMRAATAEVAAYQVGFVRLIGDREEEDAQVAGSGTLVTVDGNRSAILTAAHVVEELPKRGLIGLLLEAGEEPRLNRFTVPVEQVDMVLIAGASRTADGPDLALIILPGTVASRIQVFNKAFYNLVSRRERMLNDPRPIDAGFWAMCGVVDQWTADLALERGFTRVKGFRQFCGVGVVSTFVVRGEFDYLTFEARFGDRYEGPENYGGVSGGGIWQFVVKEKDNQLRVVESLLSGVVFYQTSVAGGIDLACHGVRSIFEHAVSAKQK